MWIDVKERKPIGGNYVLALFEFDDGTFKIKKEAYYSNRGFDSFLCSYITHWMVYPPEMLGNSPFSEFLEKELINKLIKIEIRDRKLKEIGI